jgi:hypothetical protein
MTLYMIITDPPLELIQLKVIGCDIVADQKCSQYQAAIFSKNAHYCHIYDQKKIYRTPRTSNTRKLCSSIGDGTLNGFITNCLAATQRVA